MNCEMIRQMNARDMDLLLSKFGAISLQEYMYVSKKESLTRSSTVILSTNEGGQRRSEFHLVGLENSETPLMSSV